MNEERKEKIKFSIFTIGGLLFLPITAPIMWVIDKIHFRENIEFGDAVEAFGFIYFYVYFGEVVVSVFGN